MKYDASRTLLIKPFICLRYYTVFCGLCSLVRPGCNCEALVDGGQAKGGESLQQKYTVRLRSKVRKLSLKYRTRSCNSPSLLMHCPSNFYTVLARANPSSFTANYLMTYSYTVLGYSLVYGTPYT